MDEIDDRVCLFYVSDRLKEIFDMFQDDYVGALKELDSFKRECVYNLGINAINRRKEQE